MKRVLKINGMSCSHCVNAVKDELEKVGATKVEVSLEQKTATIEDNGLSNEKLNKAIEEAGYELVEIL